MDGVAAIITALTGLLTLFGAGGAFVWRKVEARLTKIELRAEGCEERSGIQLRIIEVLWQAVEKFDPDGSAMARAKHLLDDLKGKG